LHPGTSPSVAHSVPEARLSEAAGTDLAENDTRRVQKSGDHAADASRRRIAWVRLSGEERPDLRRHIRCVVYRGDRIVCRADHDGALIAPVLHHWHDISRHLPND
jgi:hypothetical protein